MDTAHFKYAIENNKFDKSELDYLKSQPDNYIVYDEFEITFNGDIFVIIYYCNNLEVRYNAFTDKINLSFSDIKLDKKYPIEKLIQAKINSI